MFKLSATSFKDEKFERLNVILQRFCGNSGRRLEKKQVRWEAGKAKALYFEKGNCP